MFKQKLYGKVSLTNANVCDMFVFNLLITPL